MGLCLLWACGGDTEPTTTTIALKPPSITTTTAAVPAVAIFAPETKHAYPVVVMFHGGGWFGGSSLSTAPLAEYLADQGVVVFNSTYRTSSGGFPESFDDVACAIRGARVEAADYTTTPDEISVVGHSAGAHLASVIALAGDEFGSQCASAGSATVDAFVGLAGPYDPTLYRQVLPSFFGTRFENDPAPWEAGSAYTYLGNNPTIEVLLMHGGADELVPISSSQLFSDALAEAGYEVEFVEVEGAPHQALRDPNVVGPKVLEFLTQ